MHSVFLYLIDARVFDEITHSVRNDWISLWRQHINFRKINSDRPECSCRTHPVVNPVLIRQLMHFLSASSPHSPNNVRHSYFTTCSMHACIHACMHAWPFDAGIVRHARRKQLFAHCLISRSAVGRDLSLDLNQFNLHDFTMRCVTL
jgi:hypothetical protein